MKGAAELAGGKPANCDRGFGIIGVELGMEVGMKFGSEVGADGLLWLVISGLAGALVLVSSPAETEVLTARGPSGIILGEVFS